ncbi:MAG: hypothetical protein WKF85_06640 [Chitinophagaceae bacterium]
MAALLGLPTTATGIEVVSKIKLLKAQKLEAKKDVIQIEVDKAYVDGKITLEQKSDFIKLGMIELSATLEILESLKINHQSRNTEYEELLKMSCEELWQIGKLELLKSYSLEQFKIKYKEFFNEEYQGD